MFFHSPVVSGFRQFVRRPPVCPQNLRRWCRGTSPPPPLRVFWRAIFWPKSTSVSCLDPLSRFASFDDTLFLPCSRQIVYVVDAVDLKSSYICSLRLYCVPLVPGFYSPPPSSFSSQHPPRNTRHRHPQPSVWAPSSIFPTLLPEQRRVCVKHIRTKMCVGWTERCSKMNGSTSIVIGGQLKEWLPEGSWCGLSQANLNQVWVVLVPLRLQSSQSQAAPLKGQKMIDTTVYLELKAMLTLHTLDRMWICCRK